MIEDLTVEDIAVGTIGFISAIAVIAVVYYAFRSAIDNWFS